MARPLRPQLAVGAAHRIGELLPDELRQLELVPPSKFVEERRRARKKRKRGRTPHKSLSFKRLERAAAPAEPLRGHVRDRKTFEGLMRMGLEELQACRRSLLARGHSAWFQEQADRVRRAELCLSTMLSTVTE